jgi:tRNA(Ile)-lysidine synthase
MASTRKPRVAERSPSALAAVVEREVRRHVVAGDTLTIGLSGGVDSIVLLDVMRRVARGMAIRVTAVHVNHGLSANAGAWQAFCRTHCGRRRIPFEAVRVAVGGGGANVEEEARIARYRVLQRLGGSVVLLAHNRDDQAETVLLRLLRGAGVHGLSAMRPVRRMREDGVDRGPGRQILLRPLLTVARAEIERYARSRRLRWIEDESNASDRYARNFLRNEVLPLLSKRFPACRANLARAAMHLADADALLRAIASEDLNQVSVDTGIDLVKLSALDRSRATQCLRLALEARGEPPMSTETTSEVLRQLLGARSDRSPSIELVRTVVRRYRGCLVIDVRPGSVAAWACVAWEGSAVQTLPDGSVLLARRARGSGVSVARLASDRVTLRRRVGGESIRLRTNGPRRTLKNLLQEHAVPPWQREIMPLLFCGEQLVWVPGVGVASEFVAGTGETGWEFTCVPHAT